MSGRLVVCVRARRKQGQARQPQTPKHQRTGEINSSQGRVGSKSFHQRQRASVSDVVACRVWNMEYQSSDTASANAVPQAARRHRHRHRTQGRTAEIQ